MTLHSIQEFFLYVQAKKKKSIYYMYMPTKVCVYVYMHVCANFALMKNK